MFVPVAGLAANRSARKTEACHGRFITLMDSPGPEFEPSAAGVPHLCCTRSGASLEVAQGPGAGVTAGASLPRRAVYRLSAATPQRGCTSPGWVPRASAREGRVAVPAATAQPPSPPSALPRLLLTQAVTGPSKPRAREIRCRPWTAASVRF